MALTRDNTALNLVIAFNYGSRAEIAKAARRLAERAIERQASSRETSRRSCWPAHSTPMACPIPTFSIRTSGELRLSNFLLWQSAYTEFVFLEACWPDFGRELLEQAIDEYRRRNRRFGGLVERSIR